MKVFVAVSALLVAQAQANAHGNGPAPKSNGVDGKPNVHNSGVCSNAYSSEIRDYIVEAHNHARATLVPTGEAANMRRLEWSEELAISASDWVEHCQFEHYTEDYAYGQNLMYGGNSLDKATIDGWMKAWVEDEICDADRNGAGMMQLNHASAVLWADTFLVGCASKMCPNGYLTACNYFNPGNWQGQKAYQPGKPCSQCPSQAPYCDASGKLCTASPNGKPGYGPSPAPATYGPAPATYGPAPATYGPAPATYGPAQLPTAQLQLPTAQLLLGQRHAQARTFQRTTRTTSTTMPPSLHALAASLSCLRHRALAASLSYLKHPAQQSASGASDAMSFDYGSKRQASGASDAVSFDNGSKRQASGASDAVSFDYGSD